jgi:hypothetical protein
VRGSSKAKLVVASRMAKSKKPPVIEWIYNQLLDPKTGGLTRTVVTKRDIVDGIKAAGAGLSEDNPVNFIKDVIRGQGASRMWPDSLKALRITSLSSYPTQRVKLSRFQAPLAIIPQWMWCVCSRFPYPWRRSNSVAMTRPT